jgi:hypothetical protein
MGGKRVNPDEAMANLRAAGLESLEPYPGKITARWMCRCLTCGDEFATRLNNVRHSGCGCGRCGKKRGGLKRRIKPDDVSEEMRAAGLEPLEPYPGRAGTPWKCRCLRCGNEGAPTLSRVRRGVGCRSCARKTVGERLRTPAHDAIAAMVEGGYQPLEPYPGTTSKPWRCRCATCGREETLLLSRVRSGKRCLFCAGLRTDPDKAATQMRAAGLEPLEPYPGLANSPWRCRCRKCGAEGRPSLTTARTGAKGVCRRCGIERLRAAKLIPEFVARQDMLDAGLEPLEPYKHSNVGWRCRCRTCGAEVAPSLASVRRGSGCRKCGRRTTGDQLRTPEDEAIATMVAQGYTPLEPYPGANVKPWRCRCMTCGRESTPTLGNVRAGMGCGWCAGHRSDPDEVVAVMRGLGAEPLEPYRSANLPWRCRCNKCGNEITPTYANARKFSPCRYCSPFGFNRTDPAALYLLRHGRYQALKIGIASEVSKYDRIAHHGRQGWELVNSWMTPSGTHAATVEQEVLRWWREEIGAPITLSRNEMPQGGWTETAPLSHVELSATQARIEVLTAEFTRQPTAELPPLDPAYTPAIEEPSQ